MIPDFRTFIGESIWSDIHKRSNGIQNRKEDDINNLDLENFCEYLNKTYKCTSPTCIVFHKDHAVDDFIAISLYTSESGYDSFLFYDGLIVTTQLFVVEDLGILSEVKSKYTVKIFKNDFDYDCISIYPKDKSTPVTNKFLIEVLDYLLDKIDVPFEQNIEKITDVKESIWADIHKRSNGVQVRKEDDVNFLDMHDFLEYINKKYEFKDKEIISLSTLIGIPLYSHSFNITYLFISYYNSPYNSRDRINDVYSRLLYDSPLKNDITSMLKQKYSVKTLKEHSTSKFDSRVFARISTKPKNGNINNEFVIDVIDTYIDIMDNFEDIDKQIKRK